MVLKSHGNVGNRGPSFVFHPRVPKWAYSYDQGYSLVCLVAGIALFMVRPSEAGWHNFLCFFNSAMPRTVTILYFSDAGVFSSDEFRGEAGYAIPVNFH